METTTCPSCQTEAKFLAGEPTTAQEMTRWDRWGCTCTTEQAEEAMRWMDMVTR